MAFISVTKMVLHDPMFWLNSAAPLNMAFISVTLAVFHELMFWLNAAAPWNMLFMSVTCSVFHDPTSALKRRRIANKAFMSATRLVSQFVIGSYTAAPQSTAIEHVHAPDERCSSSCSRRFAKRSSWQTDRERSTPTRDHPRCRRDWTCTCASRSTPSLQRTCWSRSPRRRQSIR